MALGAGLAPDMIRAALADDTGMQARDLARKLDICEARLTAAWIGQGVTRLRPQIDGIIGAACRLGEITALTGNESCIGRVVGTYGNYTPGTHSAKALNGPIDMRFFPMRWGSAFAVEMPTDGGIRRSLQVFDHAGCAVHKIFLRDEAGIPAWDAAVAALRHEDQSASVTVRSGTGPEGARARPELAEDLRDAWRAVTDGHEFLDMVRKLGMNRLGAYRIAGAPFTRRLSVGSVSRLLAAVRDAGTGIMSFVGNSGCTQVFCGPVGTLSRQGDWQNILDPGFSLRLRLDRVAEVWAVGKPAGGGGAALSVEAFDAEGSLIIRFSGIRREGRDTRREWRGIVADLPDAQSVGIT